MGGSIALTLREPDGREHRMCRWTNSMPWMVVNRGFYEKNPEHTRQMLVEWEMMRADYVLHAEDQQFKYPMTPVYGDWPLLAPVGYGLVVLDQQQDRILTMQGYTSFDRLLVYAEPEDVMHIQTLHAAGRLRGFSVCAEHQWRVDPMPEAWPEVLAEVRRRADHRVPVYTAGILVNYAPYTIEIFDETAAGAAMMRTRLLELGFVLTPDEQQAWDTWINELDVDDAGGQS